MARAARLFAQIDVNYFEDDRILDAGDAWQLHFAAVLFCKRTLADGRISRRQLTRIAPDSLSDIGGAIGTLERVGLFSTDGTGDEITIRSWSDWNESAEDVESRSIEAGKRGNHLRWHVRRGVTDPKCSLCTNRGDSPPDIAPESPPESQSRDRLETDTYAEKELKPVAPASPTHGEEGPADLMFDAVLKACHWDASNLTDSGRGRVHAALKQLRGVDATPDEVHRRSDCYRAKYPTRELTPNALAANWAGLASAPSGEGRGFANEGEAQLAFEDLRRLACSYAKKYAHKDDQAFRDLLEAAIKDPVGRDIAWEAWQANSHLRPQPSEVGS